MSYVLKPSPAFLEQLDNLSEGSRRILEEKIRLIRENPFRYKRIKGHNLLLFRIRLSDARKEKRVVYLVEKSYIKLVCILDRKKEYKDLHKYLKDFKK